MSAKQEIAELVDKVGRTPGWNIGINGKSHWRITAPGGDSVTASMTPRNSRPLADLKSDLRRLGWHEDEADHIRNEAAQAALLADREANERRLAKAQSDAEARTTTTTIADAPTPATTKGLIFIPPTAPQHITVPAAPRTPVAEDHVDFSGYRQEIIHLTFDEACAIAERGQCRQRHLYEKHAFKLAQAMARGEWYYNPADGLVFDEHEHPCGECNACKTATKRGAEPELTSCDNPIPGCLINGQHRVWAVVYGDQDAIRKHHPNGVPFMATYRFPSKMAHIFDTGKARNASDALTVEGLTGWGVMESAALRMAMNFDQSFMESGNPAWTLWRNVQWTNTELVEAATGVYKDLLSFGTIASRLHSRAKLTRTTGMVAGFLLERDNPHGGPRGSNQDFYDGVCGSTELSPRDPRLALMRYCMRGSAKGQRTQIGLIHLNHLLRRYADWNLGIERDLSTVPESAPMFPVWRDGMKIIAGELRFDKRDPRGRA